MIHPRPIHAPQAVEPWDYATWDTKAWLAFCSLLGLVAGGMGWGWKKIIKPLLHTLRNIIRMPQRIEDIATRQREIHERMIRSEGRSRQIFDTLTHPVFEADADGQTTFANRYMLELLGLQFADLVGDGWRSTVHPEDRNEVFRAWDSAVEREHDFVMDYRWLDSHQRPIPVSVVCRRLLSEGRTIGFIGQVTLRFGAGTETRSAACYAAPLNGSCKSDES